MRVLGLPVQFVVVVVASLAVTIFFGAWVADERVEARSAPLTLSSFHESFVGSFGQRELITYGVVPGQAVQGADTEYDGDGKLWERAFLFVCPLH